MKWDEKKKWNENLWNSEMWRNEMRKRKVKANGNIKGSGSNSTSLCTWVAQCHWNSSLKFWKLKKIAPSFHHSNSIFWVLTDGNNAQKTLQTTFFFFCVRPKCFGLWEMKLSYITQFHPIQTPSLSSYFSCLQLFEYSPRISTISHALHF